MVRDARSSLAAFFFLVDASLAAASLDLRFFPDAGAAAAFLAAGASPAAPAPAAVVPDVSAISARCASTLARKALTSSRLRLADFLCFPWLWVGIHGVI